MLSNLMYKLKNKITLAANSVLPAFIFACALISFYYYHQFSDNALRTLHISFYLLCVVSFFVLLHFNQNQPIFFIVSIALSYFFIFIIKKQFGTDYTNSAAYTNLNVLLPINLIIFYFLPNKQMVRNKNAYILLAVFIELSVVEFLIRNGLSLDYRYENYPFINSKSISFLIMNLTLLLHSSANGHINQTAMFFSGLCITFGFYYSYDISALVTFFCAAVATLTLSIAKNIYYTTYKDVLTGMDSRNLYIINSKKLPLKYSIGIVSIDNYNKLINVFGKSGTNIITKMIANKIKELETDTPIYRYNKDEFLIVFINEPKEVAFDRLEAIRKSIASSEFSINRKAKALKLTISGSITEKKRSDANAKEVFKRAKKALQNTNQFAQNFTSRA